jgi:hypothetical protein
VAVSEVQRLLCGVPAKTLGDKARLRGAGARHDEHKLLAAVTDEHVDQARISLHSLGGRAQHAVAHTVPVRIVDPLEVIEIQESDA